MVNTQELESALDSVLRRAVNQKDGAIIEAYREIYQRTRPDPKGNPPEKLHAALRLGILLGLELRNGSGKKSKARSEDDQPTLW